MSWLNAQSLLGWCVFCLLAWLLGGCRRPVPWRAVLGSTVLAFSLGAVVFLVPATQRVLVLLNDAVMALLSASNQGATFLFGPLALSPGQETAGGEPSIGFVVAAQVLPAVIFFSAFMSLLHHFGLIEPVVKGFAKLFHRTLSLSGAEALTSAVHLFFGVETAAAIRPYLPRMTLSELHTVLTTNLATAASTTLAVYVAFLQADFPRIAGHLMSASVLTIPCAVVATKLMLPERETPETLGKVPKMAEQEREPNAVAALAAGATDGLRIAAGITAILIAVLGIVGLFDAVLSRLVVLLGGPTDIGVIAILAWAFQPLAWLLGLEPGDVAEAARLLGQRTLLTEVVSYQELGALAAADSISPRTVLVLSYALCGFAHVAGVGIAVGGFGALAGSRMGDLTSLAFKSLAAAILATLLSGSIAGIFYSGQVGILGL